MTEETQNQNPETDTETAAPKKPRAPKRVAQLVVGRWSETRFVGEPGPDAVKDVVTFQPAKTQPTGKASTELKDLQRWLKRPDVIKELMSEGLEVVEYVRKEIGTATLKKSEAFSASIK